jgi:carboxylesterase type B
METLLNTNIVQLDATSGENDGDIYLPTVDGNFLPPASSELVRTGCFTKMPILAGWTNNDATLFTPTTIETENDTKLPRKDLPSYNANHSIIFPRTLPRQHFAAEPAANLSAQFYRTAEIYRDILLACPNFCVGKAMANNAPPPPRPLTAPIRQLTPKTRRAHLSISMFRIRQSSRPISKLKARLGSASSIPLSYHMY